jgi:hypothetical protein
VETDMQGSVLNGAVLDTLWGDRTIQVTDVQEVVVATEQSRERFCHIDFCFLEERSRTYSLRIFDEFLVQYRDNVVGILQLWLRSGPPNGDLLTLKTLEDILGVQPR